MVPNIWKNFCASDGNVKMRFRIVSKNTKFSTLYTLKGPQLWDGEILQDEKNNWANFMCIKCKENIAHTRTSARYNWSKNIRELILIKIYTKKNIHSITINLIVSITSVELCCQRDTNVPIMYVIGPQEMMKEMKRTAMNKELDLEVRNGRTGWIQLLRTVPWRKEKFKLMIRSELLKRNQWFSNGHYTI